MKIQDYYQNNIIDISFKAGKSSNSMHTSLRVKNSSGKTIHAAKADIAVEDLLLIAKWFRDLSESPSALSFPELGLTLSFSHFEKGELYYTLQTGAITNRCWEQIGGSEIHRAQTLEKEIALSRWNFFR